MIIDVQERMKLINQKRKWVTAPRVQNLEFAEVEFNSGWFKKSDAAISFDTQSRAFTTDLSSTEYTYLTYREQNLDFQKEPQEELITISDSYKEIVNFRGEAKDLSVELFIIEYVGGSKNSMHRVELNSEQTISFSSDTEKIRLALRVKGKGSFKIDKLLIGEQAYWAQKSLSIEGNFVALEQNQWFMPKSAKLYYDPFTRAFHANFDQKQFAHIAHRASNSNFAVAPANPIIINSDKLRIDFNGEKEAAIDLRLVVIFYEDLKKISAEEVQVNNKRLITVPEGAKYARLAIRVAGKGQFTINNIVLNNIGYWWNDNTSLTQHKVSVNPDVKLSLTKQSLNGWEQTDGKIIYHPWNQFFESTLVGQEFIHLGCDDTKKKQPYAINTKEKHLYTITPSSDLYGDVQITLFILGFKRNTQTEVHQVNVNESLELRFGPETERVEFLVRVSGEGFFKSLQVNVDEKPVEITNSLTLELENSNWFKGNNKSIQFVNEANHLKAHVDIEDGKNVYMSYKETNNSFKMLPTHHLMTMLPDHEYEFLVKGIAADDATVIPMFIGYSGDEKVQVLQLKFNSITKVKPHEDVTQFRFALRVAGKGNIEVTDIIVNEMQSIEATSTVEYLSKSEIDAFSILPPKPIKELKMAVIFDEFTTASYEDECHLIKMTPDNWREVMTKEHPDLLMVESAWRGNEGTWNRRVGYYGEENMKPLFGLLQWCKEHNVPTVFWNKEDPVHFNRFIETARRFDYIFTTDENMVPYYQERAGHENVFALPFAAQPSIHNPIKIVEERENKACFAGSYYRHHEERCIDMDRLLDAAAKVGLDIYDRNYLKNLKGLMPNHQFPDRFQPFIKGNLKYYEIDKAYKGYKVMINVNTVKESPTMFSRRVYEGLACGTPVISTYAQGIEEIFPELVYMSEKPEDLYQEFKTLLENEQYYEEKALTGIRDVLTKHTYTHRLADIIDKVGLNFATQLPDITVVAFARNKEEFERVVSQFNSQKYENKKLYVLIDTFDGYLDLYNKYNTSTVQTFVRSYMHNYLNIRDWIETPFVTYFGPNSLYGENYLLDLMLSTTFTDSDFIGKSSHFTAVGKELKQQHQGHEYEFNPFLTPERTIAKTNAYSNISLEEVFLMFEEEKDLSFYARFGKQFFSSDKFNYVYVKDCAEAELDSILKKVEL
ncbi:glycosyltransferase [Priestia sp. YIM B13446]|uniref:CgeB family protein n=1 Tax=unclassified Priestia TaxID=2800374 RepID=UPI00366B89B9